MKRSRLIADIDENIKRELKIYVAQNEGSTIGSVTEKAIISYLGLKEKQIEEIKKSDIEIN